GVTARLSAVRSADLLSRPRVLGRQEDRLEGRLSGALADRAPFARPERRRPHDLAPRRFAEALQRLPLVAHEAARLGTRARDRLRHGGGRPPPPWARSARRP